MNDVRCPKCGRKFGEVFLGYYRGRCPRCDADFVLIDGGERVVHANGETITVRVSVAPPARAPTSVLTPQPHS